MTFALLPEQHKCRSCERACEWDRAFTSEPICVSCWDRVMNADVIDADNKRFFAIRRKR